MDGSVLGHYRLLERIGSGGMGVVYLARDEHLDRDVAVKVLHAGAMADPEMRRRFRREAVALSRLQHPHVAAIHDFSTEDGIDYIVMELLRGPTLGDRIRDGRLPEAEIVRHGIAIASALGAAHAQGIVHRDLKPGNVVLTEASLKVVDFGLAKVDSTQSRLWSERLSSLLPPGGTPRYMAPEQLLGREVDGRADLYALGCVLYEMATGVAPFRSDVPAILCQQILQQHPRPPRAIERGLSPRLEWIVLKLLRKDRARRHADAAALLHDLRLVARPMGVVGRLRLAIARRSPRQRAAIGGLAIVATAGAAYLADPDGARSLVGFEPAPIRSIAVLPFANASRDSSQDFLADGMTGELISRLARVSALKVFSRPAVERYRNTPQSPQHIGRELGAHAVVRGSVSRVRDRVRLSASLIRVSDHRTLWRRSYNRKSADLQLLQSELALALTNEVHSRRPTETPTAFDESRGIHPTAFDQVLRGRYFVQRGHAPDLARAIDHFKAALRTQPSYSEAHAHLAETYLQLSLVNAMPESEAYPLAMAHARRAVELDPLSEVANVALGRLLVITEWDFQEGERHLRLAIETAPGSPRALRGYGHIAAVMGHVDDLVAITRRALELDPVGIGPHQSHAYALSASGRLDEAIRFAHRGLELDSTANGLRFELVSAYQAKGLEDAAVAQLLRIYESVGTSREQLDTLRAALARGGPEGFWRAELARCGEDFVNPVHLAGIHAWFGEPDEAMRFLEKAHAKHFQGLLYIKTNPAFWTLQTDPRFQALLRKMGIPPEPLPVALRLGGARATRAGRLASRAG